MQRSILTTIGSGNRFSDLAFVWFPSSVESCAQDLEGHVALGTNVGLSLHEFASLANGEAGIRALFAKGILDSPVATSAADAVSAVVQLSQAVDDAVARRTFAAEFSRWVASAQVTAFSEVIRTNDEEARTADRAELQSNLAQALDQPLVVVERSPPTAESVMGLLSRGSGVALGAYLGFAAAQDVSPLLLFASVPGGMLVCGTAAGIADALQRGLRHRVLAWLLNASKHQVRTAVGRTLESLFPETNEVLGRGNDGEGSSRR